MMIIILLFFILPFLFISCSDEVPKIGKYPKTKKYSNIFDTYFSTRVYDPYRWLEDNVSRKTISWIKRENKLTYGYLKKISFRNKIRERIEKIWNFERQHSALQTRPKRTSRKSNFHGQERHRSPCDWRTPRYKSLAFRRRSFRKMLQPSPPLQFRRSFSGIALV